MLQTTEGGFERIGQIYMDLAYVVFLIGAYPPFPRWKNGSQIAAYIRTRPLTQAVLTCVLPAVRV